MVKRLDRRAFFTTSAVTAVAGAVGSNLEAAPWPPSQTYDFDTIDDRTATHSQKWGSQIAGYRRKDVIGMGIADMDFGAAPCVTRALAARLDRGIWGYGYAEDEMIAAVAAWHARRHALELDPATVLLSSGLHCLLTAGLRAFAPPGTRVLMTPPTYGSFYDDIARAHVLADNSPLTIADGRYGIDWDDLERRLGGDTRVFLLCNPHNPTGNCWSKDDLLRLGRLCLERHVVVFSDEIHSEFVSRGHTFTAFASLPDRRVVDNSVTFTSATKSFNLAGLRAGWCFSTRPEHVDRIRAYHRKDVNALGTAASVAALNEGEDWLAQVAAYLESNLDRVARSLDKVALLQHVKPEGTYLSWIDASGLADRIGARAIAEERTSARPRGLPPVQPCDVVAEWLGENAGVHLSPGSMFGPGASNHLRMNVATSRSLVDRALDRIARSLATL